MNRKFLLSAAILLTFPLLQNDITRAAAASLAANPCSDCHKAEPGIMMGFPINIAAEARLIHLDLTSGQEIIRLDNDTALIKFESLDDIADCRNDGVKISYIDTGGGKLATEIVGFDLLSSLDPADIIDRDVVKKIITNPDVKAYDLRSEDDFAKGHLPGAMPLPAISFEKFSHNLPDNKETPIILYDYGRDCFSHAAYIKTRKKGYKDVRLYHGGYSDWSGSDYVAARVDWLKEVIAEKAPHILIDLRSPEEFIDGHITGAVSILPQDLSGMRNRFPEEKNAPIILYGPDSNKTAQELVAWGYRQVAVLPVSFEGWRTVSDQVSYGSGDSTISYTPEVKSGTISPTEFKRLAGKNDNKNLFIDVRDPVDFYTASIPGAINIPLTELSRKIGNLPDDRKIVFYSNKGERAEIAHALLNDAKLESRYLDAEILFTGTGFRIISN